MAFLSSRDLTGLAIALRVLLTRTDFDFLRLVIGACAIGACGVLSAPVPAPVPDEGSRTDLDFFMMFILVLWRGSVFLSERGCCKELRFAVCGLGLGGLLSLYIWTSVLLITCFVLRTG